MYGDHIVRVQQKVIDDVTRNPVAGLCLEMQHLADYVNLLAARTWIGVNAERAALQDKNNNAQTAACRVNIK